MNIMRHQKSRMSIILYKFQRKSQELYDKKSKKKADLPYFSYI